MCVHAEHKYVVSEDLRLMVDRISGFVGMLPNVEDRVWARHLLRELYEEIERVEGLEKIALIPVGEEAIASAIQG